MGTGCSGQQPKKSPDSAANSGDIAVSAPADTSPLARLRSGNFQMDLASDQLATALESIKAIRKSLPGDMPEAKALDDIGDLLDSAGERTAEWTEEPDPGLTEAEIAKKLKTVLEEVEDSLHEVEEADGILESLSEQAPQDIKTKLNATRDALAEVSEALTNAQSAYQGKPIQANEGDLDKP